MIRTILLAAVLAAGCGLQARHGGAAAGPRPDSGTETHGGDKLASLFIAKGYRIYDHLARLSPEEAFLERPVVDGLLEALRTTRINPVDRPLLDSAGDVVDARTSNDPLYPGRKLIEIDRKRWEDWFAKGNDVYRLVLHEYLWVLGLDDTNYRLSKRLRLIDTPVDGLGAWQPVAELNAPFVELGDDTHDVFVAWSAGRLVTLSGDAAGSCLTNLEINTYEPTTGVWTKVEKPADLQLGAGFGAAADNDVVVAFGGICGDDKGLAFAEHSAEGLLFDPASQSFTALPRGMLAGRSKPIIAAGGGHVLVWGGLDDTGDRVDGALFNRADGSWRMLPSAGAPSVGPHGAVYTADSFLLWPLEARSCAAPVIQYDVAHDSWRDIVSKSAPEFTCDWKMATWTGDSFAFVFDLPQTTKGGELVAGAFWNPADDSWTMIPAEGGPGYRVDETTVWMGDKLVVFGGRNFDRIAVNLGSVYFPSTRSWRPLRWEGAPLARYKHAAFATEHGMLIWGGRSVLDSSMRSGAIWTF